MGKNVLTVPLKFLGFLMCRVAKQLKKTKTTRHLILIGYYSYAIISSLK